MRTDASISALQSLGPKSQQVLAALGITSIEQLRHAGSVAAYSMAKKRFGAKVSLNLLWALEAALTGIPWREVARAHRTSLLLSLEEYDMAKGAEK